MKSRQARKKEAEESDATEKRRNSQGSPLRLEAEGLVNFPMELLMSCEDEKIREGRIGEKGE